jgi:hypothetical protein
MFSIGSRPIGPSTWQRKNFNGGIFGDHQSASNSNAATDQCGKAMRVITI